MSDTYTYVYTCTYVDTCTYDWHMRYSYVWYDSFMHDLFMCVTGLIHLCDMTHWDMTHWCMTHSCVWQDSLMCLTSRIRMAPLKHRSLLQKSPIKETYVLREPCECATSRTWMSPVTHMNESHTNESCHTSEWLIHVCDRTHSCVWHRAFESMAH